MNNGRNRNSRIPNGHDSYTASSLTPQEIEEAYSLRKSKLARTDDDFAAPTQMPRNRVSSARSNYDAQVQNENLKRAQRSGTVQPRGGARQTVSRPTESQARGYDAISQSQKPNQQRNLSAQERRQMVAQRSVQRQESQSHSYDRYGTNDRGSYNARPSYDDYSYGNRSGEYVGTRAAGSHRAAREQAVSSRALVTAKNLIIAAAMLVVLAFITFSVIKEFGWVAPFDSFIGNGVRLLRCGVLTVIARALTFIGSTKITLVIGVLFGLFLLWKGQWTSIFWFVGTMAVGLGGGLAFKHLVDRPRPEGLTIDGSMMETDPCFPSGHCVTAILLWGMIAVILYVYYTNNDCGGIIKNVFKGIAIAMPILMPIMRMYLGEHYPTDCIGGLLWGGLVLLICGSIFLNKYLLDESQRRGANPRYSQRSMTRVRHR